MFEISSASQSPKEAGTICRLNINPQEVDPAISPRVRAKGFTNLTEMASRWTPSDPAAPRRLLVNELVTMLEEHRHACIKACIPAVIVDQAYPIDIMHYRTDEDINEFLTRMMWMHQEYQAAIGILLGTPDEETAKKVEDACGSLLMTEKNCVVLLI